MKNFLRDVLKHMGEEIRWFFVCVKDAWEDRDWIELLNLFVLDPIGWLFDSSDDRVPPATVALNLAIIFVLVKLLRAYL